MIRRPLLAVLGILAVAAVTAAVWTGRPGVPVPSVSAIPAVTDAAPARAQAPDAAPGAGTTAATGLPAETDAAAEARRNRFGLGLSDGDPAQVRALGLVWFTRCCDPAMPMSPTPEGTRAVGFLPTKAGQRFDEAKVRDLMRRFPGNYWLVGNEPNVREVGDTEPDDYAQALNFYARTVRAADPTARLVGPNVLNWTFVCDGCPGYPQAFDWTVRMRAAYRARYGDEPPLDVWSLHTYDLDWGHLPNGNAPRQIDQIQGMRDWLDGIPGLAGKPMWLTEAGIHWGFPGLEFRGDVVYPTGDYDFDHVERYMRELFGWLDANAERLSIEKWFPYPLSTVGFEAYQSQWAGLTFMDGPDANAPITRLGRVYQELAGVR